LAAYARSGNFDKTAAHGVGGTQAGWGA
jgi:hypothetical protein